MDQEAQIKIAELERDNEALADALAKMENAVNRSVSGMKIGVMDWLALIHLARKALKERVIE